MKDKTRLNRPVNVASKIIGKTQKSFQEIHRNFVKRKASKFLIADTHPLKSSFIVLKSDCRLRTRAHRRNLLRFSFVSIAIDILNCDGIPDVFRTNKCREGEEMSVRGVWACRIVYRNIFVWSVVIFMSVAVRICCDCCDLSLLYFVPGLYEMINSVWLTLNLVFFKCLYYVRCCWRGISMRCKTLWTIKVFYLILSYLIYIHTYI